MTSGERRLAERLESKLDDYLLQLVCRGSERKAPTFCKLPVENRIHCGDFDPTSNKIKVMTVKVSKGLEFPVVALPGVGHMPAPGEDEKEATRVFYVAATRATQRLVVGVGGDGGFGEALGHLQQPFVHSGGTFTHSIH